MRAHQHAVAVAEGQDAYGFRELEADHDKGNPNEPHGPYGQREKTSQTHLKR